MRAGQAGPVLQVLLTVYLSTYPWHGFPGACAARGWPNRWRNLVTCTAVCAAATLRPDWGIGGVKPPDQRCPDCFHSKSALVRISPFPLVSETPSGLLSWSTSLGERVPLFKPLEIDWVPAFSRGPKPFHEQIAEQKKMTNL